MLAVQCVPHDPYHKHIDRNPVQVSRHYVFQIEYHDYWRNNQLSKPYIPRIDILMGWVATGAFHDSDELYDTPKCHPHSRVAVLDDIMKWVGESESARDEFILWLFGPAGAGKSAIAKRIAEIAAERDLLIADFFSRTSSTRGTKDRLIPTLAYQLTIFPHQKLIIIDGLDECNGSQAQVAIIEAISCSFTQHKLPVIFLLVSRPEPEIVTSFNSSEPLRSVHRRLTLDDTYRPYDDIRLFFSDKFKHINRTHLLRSTIPIPWPTQETLETLVEKSSGQFIYASTVVKFVESSCHRPSARLNIILGISPPGNTNPFAELDALYNHLLSSVDDVQLTLRILSFYVMTPKFASVFRYSSMSPERFLFLETGDIHISLINLSSIVTYHELSGEVEILHASLVDFLSDKRRSTIFYIDTARTCTDFVRRILKCVKGPDGIQAGDIRLFRGLTHLSPWVLRGQLWSDILNFDLDAFINASIRGYYYNEHPTFPFSGSTMSTFWIWIKFLKDGALEDRDKHETLGQLKKSFESRLQIYQSGDWRLQLLLTLAVANFLYLGYYHGVPYCRCADILLEMDDHDLHLADRNALDLRHAKMESTSILISSYVGGDTYASAALHCMRFLSHPPKYPEKNEHSESGLVRAEWQATCLFTLEMLCKLLEQANTSLELVQFISNHDIHPTVQKYFSADRILEVNVHILAFLSQESVCPNWRIISAIRLSLFVNDQQSKFEEGNASSDEDEEWTATRHLIRQRLDQCCSNVH